jgi:CubicO group peptidase (beta-lactamase class C family)
MSESLEDLLDGWPVDTAAAAVVSGEGVVAEGGDQHWVTRLASISKVITAFAALVAVEEGSISLDEPAGRPGSTVRHLLAHAAGYDFDSPRLAADVGVRRVYSNVGIEMFVDHLEASTAMSVAEYMHLAVFEPLGMTGSELRGPAAHGVHSTVADLARFASELLAPTLVSSNTLAEMTSVQFPELGGVLPGFGRFEPNPWGVGAEIKGAKSPHWAGSLTSAATFGHFGGSGTLLWVDPERRLACVALTDRDFGPWAVEAWPPFSDAVVRRFAGSPPGH